ncbi:hypothetical protein KP509_20G007300 [Ceratopteris richardii]|uniref:glutathione transferase n=1 Tax=Ceratopteris richardii TaxID=49495 RepID=A0A8T2SDD8_CERRI|nr:hypothetical protein KP509_20G007300 [Ceratopteris richardii]
MAHEEVKVLSTWLSMFGLRVLIALKHKGVQYEYKEEDLQNKSELLLQSNPVHKKIPVLIHNGKPVCESLIIVQYIDEAWPSSENTSILPKDPYDRANARFWADYIDKKLYDAGSRILRSAVAEEREQAKKDFVEVLETLDGAFLTFSKGGLYFGGDDIGLVDVALASFLCWFKCYETFGDFKIWESSKCSRLPKWAEDVLQHASVKEGMAIAHPDKIVELVQFYKKKLEAGSK